MDIYSFNYFIAGVFLDDLRLVLKLGPLKHRKFLVTTSFQGNLRFWTSK